MDLGPLRALALDLNFDAHGVDASLTPVGGAEIVTRGIWVTDETQGVPAGLGFDRREARKVMAFKRSVITVAPPRGSLVEAPERSGLAAVLWKTDGVDRLEADHVRLILVPFDPSAT